MLEIASKEMFQEWIAKPELTVLKWYTTWCPDCHKLEEFISDVERQYDDRLAFAAIDRDKFADLAELYEVSGIPSFIACRNGQVVGRFVSRLAKTRPEVEDFLNRVLSEAGR